MNIEHWEPRSRGRGDFQWRHLLGVCSGDTRVPERVLHCDRSRGNTPLFLHPVEGQGANPRDYLRYLGDGSVMSKDQRAQKDVHETLNLNAPFLMRARVQTLEALRLRMNKRGWSSHALTKELDACILGPGFVTPEQAEVVRYHVERWRRKQSPQDG